MQKLEITKVNFYWMKNCAQSTHYIISEELGIITPGSSQCTFIESSCTRVYLEISRGLSFTENWNIFDKKCWEIFGRAGPWPRPGINHVSSHSHRCPPHKCRVPHGPGSPGRSDGCEGLLLGRSGDKNNKNLMKCLQKCFYLHFSPRRAIQSLMIPVNKSNHTLWHVDLDYNIRAGCQFSGEDYLASEVDRFSGISCLIQHRVLNLRWTTGLNWK